MNNLSRYKFYSSLPSSFKNDLEKLFFFNKEQAVVYSKIEIALEKYGNPKIINIDNNIWIVLEKMNDCQNLILLENNEGKFNILGIALHSRVSKNRAEVIHLAIDQERNNEDLDILSKLMGEIFRIYKRIKGIETIEITYLQKKLKIKPIE